MRPFKIGDRVIVCRPDATYAGCRGTVSRIEVTVGVKLDRFAPVDAAIRWFTADNLRVLDAVERIAELA